MSAAATHACADAPPRRPLYLLAQRPAHLDASAGSLVLRRELAATERYPLARIDRVVCNRKVHWSGEALVLCLASSIPIVWVDGRGHAVGSGQPRHARHCPLATALETYLEIPDWPQRFDNWLTRRRLEVLTQWALRATLEGHGPDSASFQSMKRDYVYNHHHPQLFDPAAEGWCHALTVGRLQREGLQARYWGYDGSQLELAGQLAALLWAELNLESGSLPAHSQADATSLRLFEAWARHREGRLLVHLGDLKRHVLRELDTWH